MKRNENSLTVNNQLAPPFRQEICLSYCNGFTSSWFLHILCKKNETILEKISLNKIELYTVRDGKSRAQSNFGNVTLP